MKQKFFQASIAVIFLLTACFTSATSIPITVISPTETPSAVASNTPYAIVTKTPREPRHESTMTPIPSLPPTALPTIPTFTPTFDASTIVTVTPAAKAPCPKKDASLKPDFKLEYYSSEADQKIPDFLNKGGSTNILVKEMSNVYSPYSYQFTDVTSDGIPELIFDGFEKFYDTFYILRCQDSHYVVFSGQDAMGVSEGFTIYKIVDMNKNDVPEIVIYSRGCTGNGCYRFFIGEWNGKTFVNLAPEIYLEGVNEEKIQIKDVNDNGTLELVLVGGSYDFESPWRPSIHTYMWNGMIFAEQPIEYVDPVYRFQAVQDADAAIMVGNYDRARKFYQQAIFDAKLDWWSYERHQYEQAIIYSHWFSDPTPSVKPTKDKTEYPRLAAYAYYRLMLLNIVEGNESNANIAYKDLQEKFSNDLYAHPYAEMATEFWNTYQSTHKIYDSCAIAVQYVTKHSEILIPLGSYYHGSQSHTYVPADVCPFR